jgi:type IV pilus assembly protein PilC
MIYRYSACKDNERITTGIIEAASEKIAEEALYQAGFKYVLHLRSTTKLKNFRQQLPSLFGVKTPDVIDFSRQLASFIESGSSLRTALELLHDQATKPSLKEVIAGIMNQLEVGQSFSQAIKNYPEIFSRSYWQVVQSSEKAGELEKGLRQIATYMENRLQITSKIKHSMAYPMFVICLAIGVVILLVTTVLPSMLNLFSSYQTALPPITLFAIGLMNFIQDYKIYLIIGVMLVIALVIILSRIPTGRLAMDRLILKIPAFGRIIIEYNMGIFCRTTSMLLSAGLPLPSIMEVVIQSVGSNRVILQSINNLKEKMLQGEGLYKPMIQDKLFPRMMVRMVTVGEQTGTLDSSLETLANHYEEHTSKKIQSLVSLIEPGLTLIIGIGVAFIMVSMLLPMYTIINHVR